MNQNLTADEIQCRFDAINAQPPETLTAAEAQSLSQAEAMDDGTSVPLADFKGSSD